MNSGPLEEGNALRSTGRKKSAFGKWDSSGRTSIYLKNPRRREHLNLKESLAKWVRVLVLIACLGGLIGALYTLSLI